MASIKVVDLTIDISADITKLQKEMYSAQNTLKKSSQIIQRQTSQINKSIATIGSTMKSVQKIAAISIAGIGLKKIIGEAYEYNIELERTRNSFQIFGVLQADNLKYAGQNLTAAEKYNYAAKNTKNIMTEISKITSNTPHAANELAQIYKAMYPSMRNIGASNKEIAEMTERLSILAGSAGIELQAIVNSVDNIADGTVKPNSEFGKLLKAVGLNNEELKKTDDMVKLINGTLKDLKMPEGLEKGISDFKKSLREINGELQKGAFEYFSTEIGWWSKQLKDVSENLKEINYKKDLEKTSIYDVENIDEANKKMDIVKEKIKETQKLLETAQKNGWGKAYARKFREELKELERELAFQESATKKSLPKLWKQRKEDGDLAEKGARAAKANNELGGLISNYTKKDRESLIKAVDEKIELLRKAGADEIKLAQYRSLAIQEIDKDATSKYKQELSAKAEAYSRYIKEAQKSSIKDSFDKEVYTETEKYTQLLAAHKFSLTEKEELTKAHLEKLAEIEKKRAAQILKDQEQTLKLQKETLNKQRDALINYYKTMGQDIKAGELELQKYRESLKDSGLNQVQQEELFAMAKKEIERERLLEQLDLNEKYYAAIGDKQQAELIRLEKLTIEYQKQGLAIEQINEMLRGQQVGKDNESNMLSSLGVDMGFAGEFQAKLDALQEYHDLETERITAYYALKEQNEANHQAKMAELAKVEFTSRVATAGAGFSAMSQLLKSFHMASEGENKKAAKAYQVVAVGEAIIGTYLAAQKAWTEAGNPYLGAAMAAIAIAQGMANVAQIKAQKFHSGGFVKGQADEVPAILQTGEGVLSRKGMANLDKLNTGQKTAPQETNVTVVNYMDQSEFEQFLTSRAGSKIIKNVVGA